MQVRGNTSSGRLGLRVGSPDCSKMNVTTVTMSILTCYRGGEKNACGRLRYERWILDWRKCTFRLLNNENTTLLQRRREECERKAPI
ncbi:hypothetical protein J6590_049804 [Homalodisca vitripennis]|nr:hypothetical protein J6590_049804 [Homalodisca vitripennis]